VLIVALILGVPVAPALAALVFLGAFVPIVGALVSGSVAVLVALVALGWPQALIMLGGVILVMQIEGHILQPFLLGRAVKLHPLAVLIAIAVGIIAAGIVGALLAVPLLAFTKSFVLSLAGGSEPPLGRTNLPALPLHRAHFPRPARPTEAPTNGTTSESAQS
jgi:predicted PurR-regulated permease PerM